MWTWALICMWALIWMFWMHWFACGHWFEWERWFDCEHWTRALNPSVKPEPEMWPEPEHCLELEHCFEPEHWNRALNMRFAEIQGLCCVGVAVVYLGISHGGSIRGRIGGHKPRVTARSYWFWIAQFGACGFVWQPLVSLPENYQNE